ncbi:unnamed protein product [Miscanthus lutarioriparius]|uniref:GH18 domain-containing protein n=1 Tax=Miscanthus lutarioriparius TaxID=422564 RepID=A0A811RAW9_9POAL|nr:unnamed protein product [Miscanthus lutarioriparius]
MASLSLLIAAAALVVVAASTAATAAAPSWAPPSSPRPLFREYIGAEGQNVTFADVPVHPGVDFHFILSFAIDYAAADAANASAAPPLLGGDTVFGYNATFRASSVDAWVDNAVASLTAIITRYGIDGVDIDYEHFGERETPEVFAECVGRLVRALKSAGVISVASIAPFANPDVQAHYGELWRRYGRDFDYVNFQFYAYPSNTTVPEFLGYYYEQSGRVLQGVPGAAPPGRLHGIFVWAADNSVADGFRYERLAQRFLAGAAPGFP